MAIPYGQMSYPKKCKMLEWHLRFYDGKSAPIQHQFVWCHMVFGIIVEDFRWKTRLMAGGHMTKAPATIMYASVVSRETVRIVLMIAALNNLEVKLGNILIACVHADVTENLWTTLGPEFGKDAKKTTMISWAYMAWSQQEQLFEATLQSTWNPWDVSLVRLT